MSIADENDSDLRYSEVPLKGKNKTLVKILGGVVNTGRPLEVKYWGIATPAALTPMHLAFRYIDPAPHTMQAVPT